MTHIELLEEQIADATKSLATAMETLSFHMAQDAERIRKGAIPNSLGEVQSKGSMIDAQCGELASLHRVLRDAKKLAGIAERSRPRPLGELLTADER